MAIAVRIIARLCYLAVAAWLFASAVMFGVMHLTPARISSIASHVPTRLIMGPLPFQTLWTVARRGDLRTGDPAPDFDLPYHDNSGRVSLAAHAGQRPVVLVFGSYT